MEIITFASWPGIQLREIEVVIRSSDEISSENQIRYAEALWEMLHEQLKINGKKMREAYVARDQLEEFLKIKQNKSE